jgi:hypothetical protein
MHRAGLRTCLRKFRPNSRELRPATRGMTRRGHLRFHHCLPREPRSDPRQSESGGERGASAEFVTAPRALPNNMRPLECMCVHQ